MVLRVSGGLCRFIRMQLASGRHILGLDELGHLPYVGLPALPQLQGH